MVGETKYPGSLALPWSAVVIVQDRMRGTGSLGPNSKPVLDVAIM